MYKHRIQTCIPNQPYSVNEITVESETAFTDKQIAQNIAIHANAQQQLEHKEAEVSTPQQQTEWKLKEEEHNKALKTLSLLTLIVNTLKKKFWEAEVDKLIQEIKGSPAFLKEQSRHE